MSLPVGAGGVGPLTVDILRIEGDYIGQFGTLDIISRLIGDIGPGIIAAIGAD